MIEKKTIDTMVEGPELFFELLGTLQDATGVSSFATLTGLTPMQLISLSFSATLFCQALAMQLANETGQSYDDIVNAAYFNLTMMATQTYVDIADQHGLEEEEG